MKFWKTGLLIWVFFIFLIIYGWAVWHITIGGDLIKEPFSKTILYFAKFPTNLKELIFSTNPTLINNDNYKQHLTIINKKYKPSGFILLSSKNKKSLLPEIKLFDLNKNKFVKEWKLNFKINTNNGSNLQLKFIHPILLNDSSIIINSSNENIKSQKINSKGNLIWESDNFTHHSIEKDKNGDLWMPIRLKENNKNSALLQLHDEGIAKFNPNSGKTIFSKSIGEILISNGYQSLIFSGNSENDFLHTNDIQPALTNSKFWKIGDLLISLRNKSTIFLYRPSTNKILWLKTGPWLNQHDCDFINDHEIGVFGNDVVRPSIYFLNGTNNQYIFNFETDKISSPFIKMFKDAKIKTITEGRSDILPNGEIYVEETNFGRIFFGDKNGVNAIFVDRIDKNHIANLGWSRYFTNEEMKAIFKK